MDRRTWVATLAGIATGTLAGCVAGGPGNGGTGTPSPTPTEGPAEPRFERTGDCENPGSARVSVRKSAPPEVVVEGCIVGANGCTEAALGEVEFDAAVDELRVVVVTEEERGTDEVCTQALVHRGYRVVVPFERGGPATTVVVHDGARGRREVARVDTA